MSFFGDIYAGKAEQKAAEQNAKIIESNKKIKLEEAKQIMSVHNEFNLPQFDKTVEEIQGAATTDYATSGVELSGTPVEVLYENELSLQRDRDTMTFNAENARDRSENEAIMMQAEADLQRYRGKVAKKRSYFEAGSSLLTDAATIQGMG